MRKARLYSMCPASSHKWKIYLRRLGDLGRFSSFRTSGTRVTGANVPLSVPKRFPMTSVMKRDTWGRSAPYIDFAIAIPCQIPCSDCHQVYGTVQWGWTGFAVFELHLYAGGGIRRPGNGVIAVVTSIYGSNAARVQITFAESVSEYLQRHKLLVEIPNLMKIHL